MTYLCWDTFSLTSRVSLLIAKYPGRRHIPLAYNSHSNSLALPSLRFHPKRIKPSHYVLTVLPTASALSYAVLIPKPDIESRIRTTGGLPYFSKGNSMCYIRAWDCMYFVWNLHKFLALYIPFHMIYSLLCRIGDEIPHGRELRDRNLERIVYPSRQSGRLSSVIAFRVILVSPLQEFELMRVPANIGGKSPKPIQGMRVAEKV